LRGKISAFGAARQHRGADGRKHDHPTGIQNMKTHEPQNQNRAGLSILEFVGCLMALVGGIWLGAIYLGLDLQTATYTALSESNLMDNVPEDWRPAEPDSAKRPSKAELAATVKTELSALRQEIDALQGKQPTEGDAVNAIEDNSPAAMSKSESSAGDANATAKQATVVYWTQLGEVARRQAALLFEAESSATNSNATKVAALKGRISRLSATEIQALSTKNVDASLVTFGKELSAWYESGANVYEQAVQIWDSPLRGQSSRGQVSPQLMKEWEKSHAQFTNEGRLLRDRAVAMSDGLKRQYGVEFTPISSL
jgi:hypothetical protein